MLSDKLGWCPVYFLTQKKNESFLKKKFSDAVLHNYIDSVKGVPPKDLELRVDPLDVNILNRLSSYEHIALYMMERNDSNSDSFKYRDRLGLYYYLIKYWIAVLKTYKIDIVLFEEEPHQVSDYVLYLVCRVLNRKTFMMVRTISNLGLLPVSEFEIGSKALSESYERLVSDLVLGKKIELSEEVQQYFEHLNGKYEQVLKDHLWDQVDQVKALANKRASLGSRMKSVAKAIGKLCEVSNNKKRIQYLLGGDYESDQKQVNKSIYASKQSYAQSLHYKYKTIRKKKKNKEFYNQLANDSVDYSLPYVFCALQYQPEKSTCPLGGRFVDQVLMVESLSSLIPKNWMLYIKEHPSQFVYDYTRYGDQFRSLEFYKRLLTLPNVKLIPFSKDVFELIDGSEAVASVGGTICWEAAVRGRPALNFAQSWFMGCEGVWQIESVNDISGAMDRLIQGQGVDCEKVKLFAHAIDQLGYKGVVGGESQLEHQKMTYMDNAEIYFKAVSDTFS